MEDLDVDKTELTCYLKEQQPGKMYAVFIRFRRGTSSGILRVRYLLRVY